MKNANQVRDPSPDEIRKQCRKIQKEWSDSTWRQRAIRRRKPSEPAIGPRSTSAPVLDPGSATETVSVPAQPSVSPDDAKLLTELLRFYERLGFAPQTGMTALRVDLTRLCPPGKDST